MIRLVVTGGRDFWRPRFQFDVLDAIRSRYPIEELIVGGAAGADAVAYAWALSLGIPHIVVPAEWDDLDAPGAVIRVRSDGKEYNAAAGGLRNQRMIDECRPTHGLVLPGGRGTADMKKRLAKAKIPIWEIRRRR